MRFSFQLSAGLVGVLLTANQPAAFAQNAGAKPPVPAAVTVRVDWTRTIAKATRLSYGVNAFHGFDPANVARADYQAGMARMRPGLIRLHNWGMMEDSKTSADGWIDTAHQAWDAAKIQKALAVKRAYDADLLINIPGFPSWMDKDKDGCLDADQFAAYAQFCADLVRIANGQGRHRVRYWEITNEQDDRYFKPYHANGGWGGLKDPNTPDRVAELAKIVNRCAVAMKKVDPTIKTGGPAAARPDFEDFVRRFAAATLPNLDFFSYHGYASGSKDDSDEAIYDRSGGFGANTRRIVQILDEVSPKRHIPAILDEYNISWTWETRDPRMTNYKGAIFDALTLIQAVTNGADGTAAWNDQDGIYGKMDMDCRLRPPGDGLHLFNAFGTGDVVKAESSDEKQIVVFAVHNAAEKRRALWVVNRADVPIPVVPTFSGKKSFGTAKVYSLTAQGYTQKTADVNTLRAGKWVAPEQSVSVWVWSAR